MKNEIKKEVLAQLEIMKSRYKKLSNGNLNIEKELNKIEFVGAMDGKIVFYDKMDEEFSSNNPEKLARYMKTHNWDERYLASSSLHFASEYGFETDEGAKDLLKKAIKIFKTL